MAGGGRKMSQLPTPDRCWVVAEMTILGLTAEEIADRLDCSLRLVRSIRAEDMTAVCTYVLNETRNFDNELRLAQSQAKHLQTVLAETKTELDRTKLKLDRVLDAHIIGAKLCPKCGTPMTGYNLYRCSNGKDYCRECHRVRSRDHRARSRQYAHLPFAVARPRVTQIVTTESVTT